MSVRPPGSGPDALPTDLGDHNTRGPAAATVGVASVGAYS